LPTKDPLPIVDFSGAAVVPEEVCFEPALKVVAAPLPEKQSEKTEVNSSSYYQEMIKTASESSYPKGEQRHSV
jgi:hypothetical protein